MRGVLIYAVIVLIVTIVLLAFSILAAYYVGVLRSGTTLTSGQINAVFFTQIVAAVMIVVIMIWSIFAMVYSRRGYRDDDLDEVDDDVEMEVIEKEVVRVKDEKNVRNAAREYGLKGGDEVRVDNTGDTYVVKEEFVKVPPVGRAPRIEPCDPRIPYNGVLW